MTTALITHDDCYDHVTPPGHPEQVARLDAVLSALEGMDLMRVKAPMAADDDLLRVHPKSHIDAVRAAAPSDGWRSLDADTHMSPGALADQISVGSPNNAPLLEIRITDSDPETAALLANSVAIEATMLESDLVATSVLSEATVPSRPALNSYILVAIAGVIGAQLGAAVLALVRRMSNVVRSADDIRERCDFALLGELGVRATPTRIVVEGGEELGRKTGFRPKSWFKGLIDTEFPEA